MIRLLVAISIASVLTPAAQQTPATPSSALIVGRVVDAVTGTPVPGVLVTLLQMNGAIANTQPIPEPRMVTDAQGRFLFRGAPAGSYFVQTSVAGSPSFTLTGFIVTGSGFPIGGYLNGGYGQKRPYGPLQNLDLQENQRVIDLVIRMWKAGAISGRVIDEAGEPQIGQVVGVAQITPSGRLVSGPTVRTDDRGFYRVPALAPGQYIVVVPQTVVSVPLSIGEEWASPSPDPARRQRFVAAGAPAPPAAGVRVGTSAVSTVPDSRSAGSAISNAMPPLRQGDAMLVYPTTFFPSAVRFDQAARVAVRSGEEQSNTDVQLRPVRAGSISGTVVDEGGAVPNMGLHLMPADMGRDAAVLEAATTTTDARGGFSFPVVPSGQYTLLALRTGTGSPVPAGGQQAVKLRTSEVAGAYARLPVTVAGRPIENITVTMRWSVFTTGEVVFDGSRERPPAERLRAAQVTIYPQVPLFRQPGSAAFGNIDPATSKILIRGISPPGRFLVGIPAMPAPWVLQSVKLGGVDVTDAPIDVSEDGVADFVFTYTDRPASLSGTVAVAPRAESDTGVFLFPANRTRWADARTSTRSFRTVRANAAGAFSFSNVLPGDYLVVAVPDTGAADWPDEQFIARLAGIATSIRVGTGESAAMTLKPGTIK